MSKKSKKQRAKAKPAQVRRESGIVLRAVTPPPSAGGKLIELKPKVPVADPPTEPAPSDPPAPPMREASPAVEVAASDVVVPANLEAGEPNEEGLDQPPADVAKPTHRNEGGGSETPAATTPVPPSMPPEEHRTARRVSVEVDIHLSSDSHFFAGLSGDISEGGLFLSTYRPLTVGTQVDIEFSLPGTERPVRARGEVRWIREHSTEQPRGVGIAFDDLSDDDRAEIHAFCSRRPPLYYEDVG